MPDAVVNTYLLASVGVALEVAFTAISDIRQGDRRLTGHSPCQPPRPPPLMATCEPARRLTGHSYLWMFPIYALVYPLFAVAWPVLEDVPWPVRGAVYVVAFFAVEYASGWVIRRLVGECPWESGYLQARWGVHGLIRLDYAPAWFVVALLFERLFLYLT